MFTRPCETVTKSCFCTKQFPNISHVNDHLGYNLVFVSNRPTIPLLEAPELTNRFLPKGSEFGLLSPSDNDTVKSLSIETILLINLVIIITSQYFPDFKIQIIANDFQEIIFCWNQTIMHMLLKVPISTAVINRLFKHLLI